MANIIVPLPDAAGYWHFTYITTDPLDGRWYGGKRSCKKHPLSDPYKGSGNWIKAHPARGRLQRKIVAFYATSAEVFTAGAKLVTWNSVLDDPLCMNECEGGDGLSVEGVLRLRADPVFRAAQAAGFIKRSSDPVWRKSMLRCAAERASDPAWIKKQAAASRALAASPEWRSNNLAHLKRVHASGIMSDPEVRAKLAAASAKRWADPEYRARLCAAHRRRWETRRGKPVAAIAKLWADPVFHAKMCDAARRGWETRRAKALNIQAEQGAIVDKPETLV